MASRARPLAGFLPGHLKPSPGQQSKPLRIQVAREYPLSPPLIRHQDSDRSSISLAGVCCGCVGVVWEVLPLRLCIEGSVLALGGWPLLRLPSFLGSVGPGRSVTGHTASAWPGTRMAFD